MSKGKNPLERIAEAWEASRDTERSEWYVDSYTKAHALGMSMDQVFQMGILCAQLGLTPDQIPSMARAYMMLQTPGMGEQDWQFVTQRFLNAVREANRD